MPTILKMATRDFLRLMRPVGPCRVWKHLRATELIVIGIGLLNWFVASDEAGA